MVVADLTHAYHATSGGIRTFVDLKRRYVLEHTQGHHVLVVPGETNRVERGERWSTYTVAAPTLPGGSTYRFWLRSGGLQAALADAAPDLVELNTYYAPAEYRAAYAWRRATRLARRSAYVTVQYHTDFAESYVRTYTRSAVGPLARPLTVAARRYVRSILDRADAVMTLAPMFVRQLDRFGVHHVELVPQFVDLDHFTPAKRSLALRERLGVPAQGLFLLYFGRFDSEKHVETLIRATDRLPATLQPTLVMAGDGPLRGNLEAQAAASDRLVVLPYFSDREAVAATLASADLYVTAGPHEVAAFSVVEAQASGLPVVGVASGGLLDRIDATTGALVPVDDDQAMAMAIARIAADRDAFSARARAHAEAHYSWLRCFEAVFARYRALGVPA